MQASHWKRYGQGVLAVAALLVGARGWAEPPKGEAPVSCAISGPQCGSPEV